MPLFSVVVLHHNKAPYSRACLESLLAGASNATEIINVDNGSRDETAAVLDDWETRAQSAGIATKRLTFDTNIGAVRGRNEAVQIASGEHIAFLDNDTLISDADWLPELAARLDSTPHCALVTPKLLFPWAPFDIECLGCAVSPQGRIRYLERGAARESAPEAREVQCAISAAWLFKRATWNRIGPLDEAFSPVQYEDLDWCYRARAAGLSVWTAPEVEVFHFEHTTTAGSDDINFRYVTAKNSVLFKKRWGDTFRTESGTSDADAAWQTLPKIGIEELPWRALLPVKSHAADATPSGATSVDATNTAPAPTTPTGLTGNGAQSNATVTFESGVTRINAAQATQARATNIATQAMTTQTLASDAATNRFERREVRG